MGFTVKPPERLTKADTVALWHAVDNFGYMVRALADEPGKYPQQTIDVERSRLAAAKRALRKVNALRKQQAPRGRMLE